MSVPGRRSRLPALSTAACFAASIAGSIGLVVVYLSGGQPQLEGIFLTVVAGGIGIGIVLWAKHDMPTGEVEEEREPLASSADDIDALRAVFAGSEDTVRRRRLLQGLLGGAVAAMGAALLLPVRSLGPEPGRGFKETAYRRGRRVVTEAGRPVRPDELPTDSIITVWPEGDPGGADSSTLLIRIRREHSLQAAPGREGWDEDGIVAYSKLCTHTGCPVGLYQAEAALLLCPCHQSTFDVLDGARPVFGPAARPLPQLPLGVDEDGFLVAEGDFSDPVGPGFWDRGRD
ncbi:MAG: ubiquinol-cytochrome c reductase iron-sulfur subunit [Acidimicrobiales bacterium]